MYSDKEIVKRLESELGVTFEHYCETYETKNQTANSSVQWNSSQAYVISLKIVGNEKFLLSSNKPEISTLLGQLMNLQYLELSNVGLDEIPKWINKLKKIRKLFLYHNKISTIPNWLSQLEQLEVIDLSFNNIAILPQWISRFKHLTSINISFNNFEELPYYVESKFELLQDFSLEANQLKLIPKWIGQIDQLKYLSLSNNLLSNLPQELPNLKQLTVLKIANNQLTIVPEWFVGLGYQLKYLDLSQNAIGTLPEWMEKFKKLTDLYLSNNNFANLPNWLEKLSNLLTLDLSGNNFAEIPICLQKLKQLITLNISNNILKEIPIWINELKELSILNISNNNLVEVPNSITTLEKLTKLNLQNIGLKDTPESLGNLKNLDELVLSKNKGNVLTDKLCKLHKLEILLVSEIELQEIPQWMCKMNSLKVLDLSGNMINEIPNEFFELDKLVKLNLSNNNIQKIPDSIGQLRQLKNLNLSNMQIDMLPKSLIDLGLPFDSTENGNGIVLHHTKLRHIDISLFDQPRKVINAFYEGDLINLKESKVIFIGDGDVGKSTLIHYLMYHCYQENIYPTDGICINNWMVPIRKNEKVKLRLWDFGGQEVMHAMHRCFLTSRTTYVIVIDSRSDCYLQERAMDWLDCITSFAKDCPIILVLNKFDLNKNVGVDEFTLKIKYKYLQTVIKTSAKEGTGVDILKEAILSAVMNSAGLNSLFNRNWLKIKQKLETMGEYYIKNDDYIKICEEANVKERYIQQCLLDWFKDLGVSFYYKNNTGVAETIKVLNPQWLTNGIYRLILRTQPDNGIILLPEIFDILQSKNENDIKPEITYSYTEADFILSVMRQFKISLNMGNKELIPLKLSKNTPAQVAKFDRDSSIHLSWESDYIPNNLIHRLMIKMHDELNFKEIWRSGAIFSDDTFRSLVYMDSKCIHVFVNSNQKKDKRIYLEKIRGEILKIINDLNIQGTEMIHYLIDGKIGKEPYEDIVQQYNDGERTVYLHDIKKKVEISILLQQVYIEPNIRKENWAVNEYNFINSTGIMIGDFNKQEIKNVGGFDERISNSDITSEQADQLLKYLNELIDSGKLESKDEKCLVQILKEPTGDKKTMIQKVKEYLSNGANLATIIGVAGPPFYEFLKLAFKL